MWNMEWIAAVGAEMEALIQSCGSQWGSTVDKLALGLWGGLDTTLVNVRPLVDEMPRGRLFAKDCVFSL
jgi:hypothetical protein